MEQSITFENETKKNSHQLWIRLWENIPFPVNTLRQQLKTVVMTVNNNIIKLFNVNVLCNGHKT